MQRASIVRRFAAGSLIAGCLAAARAPVTGNLIPNPSFASGRDGGPASWHAEGDAARLDEKVTHGSGRSLAIALDTAHSGAWRSDVVDLEVGRDYALSGWVRTQALARDAVAELTMSSLPVGVSAHAGAGASGAGGDWTRIAVAFTATANHDRILCAAHGTGGTAWFDQLELVPTPASALPAAAVTRCGAGYRFDQAGWIQLHIEGAPYERGYQHGTLLAKEIAEFVRRNARSLSPANAAEAWKSARVTCDALFLRGYCEELLLEMKGIADGAAAHGAKYNGRPVDLLDVVALNSVTELSCLEGALAVTPTGLEGRSFRNPELAPPPPPRVERCSAFAATGPATADGHIVFGHITMFGLNLSHQFNVMVDVKPDTGHRVVMQGYPGAIESAMDWFMNDAGILITETTIDQGPFRLDGRPEADRIRRAAQYATTIDEVVAILGDKNNGLYANEWMVGDVKTDEIALFELGTQKTKLWRSSRNEWPGGTTGFYWGCNNTKDPEVASEYVVDVHGKPANLLFDPSGRDLKWLELFARSRTADGTGAIDLRWGTRAFATPPICTAHALDAKVTTSDMARRLMTWACFGHPNGTAWEPTDTEKRAFDDAAPIVSSGWTLVRVDPELPVAAAASTPTPTMPMSAEAERPKGDVAADDDEEDPPAFEPPFFEPAWRGSFSAAGDGDLWLAAGAPSYYAVAEIEQRAQLAADPKATAKATREVARRLGLLRARWHAATLRDADRPLAALRFEFASDHWHQLAENKGALVLHELRRAVGDTTFFATMNDLGRRFGGKAIATADLRASVEKRHGADLGWFFDQWLTRPGLPRLELADVKLEQRGDAHEVSASIRQSGPPYRMPVTVTLVSEKGQEKRTLWLEGAATPILFTSATPPLRLVVDPDGEAALANGAPLDVAAFLDDLDHTLIVYGTSAEEAANRYAAERIHRRFLEGWWQLDLPMKRDVDVTAAERLAFHLVLVGRPESNAVAAEFAAAFPIAFTGRAFTLDGQSHASAGEALVESAVNPAAPARALVLFAGVSPDATCLAAENPPSDAGFVLLERGKLRLRGFAPDPALTHRF